MPSPHASRSTLRAELPCLEIEIVDLLLLSVSVVLLTSGLDTSLVVKGLSTSDGVLQVLDLTYVREQDEQVKWTSANVADVT